MNIYIYIYIYIYIQPNNKYTLIIMKILRTASLGSNFTGSYRKKSIL